jgi:uncharacterized protein
MTFEFAHEPDASRYAMRSNGALIAVVDYSLNGGLISFTRAFTTPMERGKGNAARVVEFAVNEVEKGGDLKIVPMCWYVRDWFVAHPERARLLAL